MAVLLTAGLAGGCPSDSEPGESDGTSGASGSSGSGGSSGSNSAGELSELVDRLYEAEYVNDGLNCECFPEEDDCPAQRTASDRRSCVEEQLRELMSTEPELLDQLRCAAERAEAKNDCAQDKACDERSSECEYPECPDSALETLDDCD
jgi:hypothetical protein